MSKERKPASCQKNIVKIELPIKKGEPIKIVGLEKIDEGMEIETLTRENTLFLSPSMMQTRIQEENVKLIREGKVEAITALTPIITEFFEDLYSTDLDFHNDLVNQAANTRFWSEKDPQLYEVFRKACSFLAKNKVSATKAAQLIMSNQGVRERMKPTPDQEAFQVKSLAEEIKRYYPANFSQKRTTPRPV